MFSAYNTRERLGGSPKFRSILSLEMSSYSLKWGWVNLTTIVDTQVRRKICTSSLSRVKHSLTEVINFISLIIIIVVTGSINCSFHRCLSRILGCDSMRAAGVWVVLSNGICGTLVFVGVVKGVTYRNSWCCGAFWFSEEKNWQTISLLHFA